MRTGREVSSAKRCARLDHPWTSISRASSSRSSCLLLSLTFHEAAHAWSADILGDPTARRLGRVSLNPAVHIDPIGTLLFPLIAMLTERAAHRLGQAGAGESRQPARPLAAEVHADCGRRAGQQPGAGRHRRRRPAPDRLHGGSTPATSQIFRVPRVHGHHQRRCWRCST